MPCMVTLAAIVILLWNISLEFENNIKNEFLNQNIETLLEILSSKLKRHIICTKTVDYTNPGMQDIAVFWLM